MDWETNAGRHVSLGGLRLTLTDPQAARNWSLTLQPASREASNGAYAWKYKVALNDKQRTILGSARLEAKVCNKHDDAIVCRLELNFQEPVGVDLAAQLVFELPGPPPKNATLPERSGRLTQRPLQSAVAQSGRFELGAGAASGGGSELGMPVLDLAWESAGPALQPLRLAVAADPYCGCSISCLPGSNEPVAPTRVTVSTTYRGSVVPLTAEKRTVSLEFHRRGVDGSLRSFYRTIPEIEPGAAWTQGIHLVYYDYLSEGGEGWFKDLQTLAQRIPAAQRGRVALCEHGWYDYFQQYAYDHQQKKLLKQWIAFPGTRKTPMNLEAMHKRLKFAKGLGFRTLLYFADGTNSDSGAPNFRKDFVLKDRSGKTFPGWKGPDSLGQPLKMDPSVPGLRDWYCGYLAALLDEYGQDVDGFVWDETFYIPAGFVSYTSATPAYADRAMMGLMADLAQLVQQRHKQNPDLVFLAADCGWASYALVAHGTYQDTLCDPKAWGRCMFANYRNCLWSCNWTPVTGARNNEFAATQLGLPQGLSNGWGNNRGPHNMPPELLQQVLDRFQKNVAANRQRERWLSGSDPAGTK